jgi:DNA-binding GntR family transcriptional regulator
VAGTGPAGIRAAPAPEAASLADRAYYAIRDQIVSLALRPGAVINERELMDRLDLGRTPIREAVRRLAQEQLVEVYPRRGTFVTSVEIRDLASICDVRLALEAHAARLAAERASDADREEIRRLIAELDADLEALPEQDDRALMAIDERIHGTVYRATHNPFLVQTLEEYYLLALRIWFLALEQPRELEQAVLEHRELLEAILDRDADRAEAVMRAHVRGFETAIRRALLQT